MAKRRKQHKRVSDDIPAKFTLYHMADDLWAIAVKNDCNHQCVVCKKFPDVLHAHHLVPRGYAATRFDTWNGVALCYWDHTKNPELAPHQNAAGWIAWLSANMPARAEWYMQNRHPAEVTKDADYYCQAIWNLKQYVEEGVYVDIVGQKFSEWMEEQHAED